jgi:hypothetical protein
MKNTKLRMSLLAVILLAGQRMALPHESGENGHASGLMARVTLPDGTRQTVKLQGVGCPISICSRVAMKGKSKDDLLVSAWLDSMVAIKDITESDALFVKKDGTEQRLSLVKDFRVLYLANRLGGAEKLDLTKVKSIEFLTLPR